MAPSQSAVDLDAITLHSLKNYCLYHYKTMEHHIPVQNIYDLVWLEAYPKWYLEKNYAFWSCCMLLAEQMHLLAFLREYLLQWFELHPTPVDKITMKWSCVLFSYSYFKRTWNKPFSTIWWNIPPHQHHANASSDEIFVDHGQQHLKVHLLTFQVGVSINLYKISLSCPGYSKDIVATCNVDQITKREITPKLQTLAC